MDDLDVAEAHRRWSEGALAIVDVREADEHAEVRVPGVPLIPMSEFAGRVDDLPDGRPLAILCRSGARSGRVADYLNATGGHGDVANIEGGIIAWVAADLPHEEGPPA